MKAMTDQNQEQNSSGAGRIIPDLIDLEEIEKHLFPSGVEFSEDRQKMLFEQYKILTQSADQLAARRQAVNGFFLSINTFMLAGVGFVFKESFDLYVHEHRVFRLMILAIAISMIGLAVDLNWSKLLDSYGKLIRGQIRVLEAMEKHIPAAVVTAQAAFHRKDFHFLSSLETNIARTFQVIYVLTALGALMVTLYHPAGPVPH